MDDDELTPEQRFAAEDADRMVARAIVKGKDSATIVADLLRLGWSREAAENLVATTASDLDRFNRSDEDRAQLVREAGRQVAIGLFIAIFGVFLTALTIFGALGGFLPFYVVTYGLILVGLVVASRGWGRWRLYRKPILPFDPGNDTQPPTL